MLGLLLDAVVLMGILRLLQGDDAPDFIHTLLVSVGLSVVNFVSLLLLGLFGLIPILIIDGLILMYFCYLPLKQALIALALFMVYKIGISVAFMLLFA
jgi:hypothetical protein